MAVPFWFSKTNSVQPQTSLDLWAYNAHILTGRLGELHVRIIGQDRSTGSLKTGIQFQYLNTSSVALNRVPKNLHSCDTITHVAVSAGKGIQCKFAMLILVGVPL